MTENHIQAKVYYAETDQGGVVYYANYLKWFEMGRTELLRDAGIEKEEFEKEGLLLPVVHIECDYHHPATYQDNVLIKTRLTKIGTKSIRFDYKVEKDNVLCVSGHTVNVFASKSGSAPIPEQVKEKLAKIKVEE